LLTGADCREWADAVHRLLNCEQRGERKTGDRDHPENAATPAPAVGAASSAFPYINRELSSLEFQRRVLSEAGDERNPLIERVKFLAIFASNLDEFFQIRVSGLMEQAEAHAVRQRPERSRPEQLADIRTRFRELLGEQTEIFGRVCAALREAGVEIVEYETFRSTTRPSAGASPTRYTRC